ncbi:MAG: S9 family peptidase [Saprospiraceae bacterium]
MKKLFPLIALTVIFACQSRPEQKNTMTKNIFHPEQFHPPVAKEVPKDLTVSGDTRVDPYYWLNQREDKAVVDFLNAENAYADSVLAPVKALKEDLFNELKGRIKEDDSSVPYLKHGYYYYTRFETGKEYPIFCRKKGSISAQEQVLLNVNQLAEGHAYMLAGGLDVSPDDKYMMYFVDTTGRNLFTSYILNLKTGTLLPDRFETAGSMEWINDSKTIIYDTKDAVTLRSDKVWRHTLGNTKDELLFVEKDETAYVGLQKSKSDQYIFMNHGYTQNVEAHVMSANDPKGKFTLIKPRVKDFYYSMEHYGDQFYLLTNKDGAKNFKVMKTPITKPSVENWTDVIPHDENVLIENFEIFKNQLVIQERKNGMNQIMIRQWSDGKEHFIDFGEPTYTATLGANFEYDTDTLRYIFNSFKTPPSTIDYNMNSKTKEIKKVQPVLGGFDTNNYETELIWVEARDKTKVPLSLIYRKGIKHDGSSPCYLIGYGSYGSTYDPEFNSSWLSLIDRGFVCGIAHIRGGMEMGFKWYEQGKMMNKMNTFTDFIDCSQWLVDQKYTSKDKLFVSGRSAGGLLMGAVTNMRPDLFKGIITGVPFVDVLTTMSDPSIPLTTGEYTEWGNPNIKAEYDYMKTYSPYDNLEAKEYPNIYVHTSLHDSQVQYFEPAKYVAKLRKLKKDNNSLLLVTNMTGSHGGASGRFQRLHERADEYSFMLGLLGIQDASIKN